MTHPLEQLIRGAEGFLLIGDSSKDRFPALSFHAYTAIGKPFFCFDLGGLTESRGKSAGRRVFTRVDELPDGRGDLAIVWVHPHDAVRAVEIANQAGCRRVWFSFKTGHDDAVRRARELGIEVVEIGRCPVYYLDDKPIECKLHTGVVRISGTYGRPPQTEPGAKRRELF